jgi:site-specific recombinase XerC
MRRTGPDGKDLPADAFVFGVGERVKDNRVQWEKCCTPAGIEDLHHHDLRREFGSRLLETHAELHDVKLFLGHSNISQTNTYLASNTDRLKRALDRLDPEPVASQSHCCQRRRRPVRQSRTLAVEPPTAVGGLTH